MKVKVKVDIFEVDGEPRTIGSYETIAVRSHETHNNIVGYVILEMPDGKHYTVLGQDLKKAADRCLDTE